MACRSNPLTQVLLDHLSRLDELKYQSFLHESTTDKTVKSYQEDLDGWDTTKVPKPSVMFGLSSRLAVTVLVGKPRLVYPVTGYGAGDEQHMKVIREIDQRVQGQILALLFEAVESYFRDFMGKLFFLTRKEDANGRIKLKHRRSEFRESVAGKDLHAGTPQYFDAYVEWYGRRNCDDLLDDLRKACPQFDQKAQRNASRTHFFDYYRTLSVCRHLAVHAGGLVEDQDLKRLRPEWRKLLCGEVIRTSQISKRRTLLPNESFVRWAIDRSASFMHMAYFIVSDELKLAIPQNLGGRTRVAKR